MKKLFYTKEMDKWLEQNAPLFHWKELAKKFNEHFNVDFNFRTLKAHCATKLKLFNNLFPEEYTEEQKNWLREHSMIDYKTLTEMFNKQFNANKKVDCLRHYCQRLGIVFKSKHYWSEEEIELLRSSYGKISYKELGKLFGLSCKAVQSKAKELGIQKKRVIEEVDEVALDNYFKDHYLFEGNNEISKKLGLNQNSRIFRKISHKYRKGGTYGMNAFMKMYLPVVKDKGELWEKWKTIFPERVSDKQRRKLFNGCTSNSYKVIGVKLPRYFQDVKPLGYRMVKASCVYVKVRNQTENGRVLYPNYMDCYEKEYELTLGYKVPEGMIAIHLDGDFKNNSIDNLRVVSRETYLGLNKQGWYGLSELTSTACDILEAKQFIRSLS